MSVLLADKIKQKNALTFRLLDASDLDRNLQAKTSNYTAITTDDIVFYDATSGAGTVTLYTATGNSARLLTVTKIDSSINGVVVDGNASETINGQTTLTIANQYSSMTMVNNGTNWSII